MDSEYRELERRLDYIIGDTLNVQAAMRARYRRIREEARTARDKTRVHLEELLVGAGSVTPEIWQDIRERADLSLDSLRRLFISADSLHKLVPKPGGS